jgi:uncharacterized membrane protein
MSNEQPGTLKTNKHSIISLILGIITLLLFCGGILVPIPFTTVICVPISALIGVTALTYGFVSLNRIKKHNETGHTMAWTGILIGGLVFLCMLCLLVTIASILYISPEANPLQPFIDTFQI